MRSWFSRLVRNISHMSLRQRGTLGAAAFLIVVNLIIILLCVRLFLEILKKMD